MMMSRDYTQSPSPPATSLAQPSINPSLSPSTNAEQMSTFTCPYNNGPSEYMPETRLYHLSGHTDFIDSRGSGAYPHHTENNAQSVYDNRYSYFEGERTTTSPLGLSPLDDTFADLNLPSPRHVSSMGSDSPRLMTGSPAPSSPLPTSDEWHPSDELTPSPSRRQSALMSNGAPTGPSTYTAYRVPGSELPLIASTTAQTYAPKAWMSPSEIQTFQSLDAGSSMSGDEK